MKLIHSEVADIAMCNIAAGTKWQSRGKKKWNVKLIFTVALSVFRYISHSKKGNDDRSLQKIDAIIEFFILAMISDAIVRHYIKVSAAHKSN